MCSSGSHDDSGDGVRVGVVAVSEVMVETVVVFIGWCFDSNKC